MPKLSKKGWELFMDDLLHGSDEALILGKQQRMILTKKAVRILKEHIVTETQK